MVMWGDGKAEVLAKLAANGITGEAAEAMHRQAFSERVAAIRHDAWNTMEYGLFWLVVGVGAHYELRCWTGLHGIPGSFFRFVWPAVLYGAWQFCIGLTEMMFAHHRQGSLADNED
ncbi:MAG: hypothetical protein JWM59_3688 [Verrucomicrobiales bacterium]|nr:hypothetical protein [Verrucomicrobiales bacterium]